MTTMIRGGGKIIHVAVGVCIGNVALKPQPRKFSFVILCITYRE